MCGRGLESIRGEWFAIRVTLGKVMTPHLGAVKRAREVIWPTRPTSWTKTKTPPFMKVEKLLGFGVCGPAIFWPPRKQTLAHVHLICGKSARAGPETHMGQYGSIPRMALVLASDRSRVALSFSLCLLPAC